MKFDLDKSTENVTFAKGDLQAGMFNMVLAGLGITNVPSDHDVMTLTVSKIEVYHVED